MRVEGELILIFARDAVFLGDILASNPHVVVVVNIPQAVVHHGIDDLCVAQAISLAGLREKIRSIGHRLHAAGDDDGSVLCLHSLCRKSDRFQSRATNFVDCHGTCGRRESAVDCGLTRWILSEPGSDDVAHDAFVDLRGIDARALHRFANGDGAELSRAEIGEAALKFSHRSAASGNNHHIVKRGHDSSSSRMFLDFYYRCAKAFGVASQQNAP